MGELYEPYPKLPKNIRQIGERDDIVRVYAEDYVNTYLKRLFPVAGQDLRAGLLLGNIEEHGGIPYVFIDGALEMEGVTQEGEKVVFSDEAWKRAYQTIEEMFPKRTVQGWFLCGAMGSQLSPLNYWKQHSQYFAGKNKLMYLNSALEGEEALYITSSDGFYKLRGYCIYYERNQMMQDYMVMRKENQRVEDGGSDPVIRNFRRKMEQKKEHANDQSRTIQLLKGMCGCLAVLALAGGVAAFNSAEEMRDMEAVMVSVLPEAESLWDSGKSRITQIGGNAAGQASSGQPLSGEKENNQSSGKNVSGIIIEEAAGDVFPIAGADSVEPQNQTKLPENQGEVRQESTSGVQQESKAKEIEHKEAELKETELNGTKRKETEYEESKYQETENKETKQTTDGTGEASKESGQAAGGTAEASKESGQAANGTAETVKETVQTKAEGEQAQAANSAQAAPVRQKEPKPGQGVYVVQQGETLYGICFKLYQNINRVDEICKINGITDVNMLEAGFRLIVP